MKNSSTKFVGSLVICLFLGIGAVTVYFTKQINRQQNTITKLQIQLQDSVTNHSNFLNAEPPQPTIKQNEVAKDNADLKQEITRLAKALADAEQRLQRQRSENEIEFPNSRKNIAQQISQSPEFIKSTLVPLQVRPVVNELTSKLDLSAEEAERLMTLLQAKAEADVDASAPNIQKIGDNKNNNYSESDIDHAIALVDSQLGQNQRNYENELEEFLSDKQLESYREFEKQKLRQQQEITNNFRISELNMIVNDLNEYQQQEIKTFFEKNTHLNNNINLGVSGSPYARQQSQTSFQIPIQQQLEYLLTPEQLRKYSTYQTNNN